MKFLILLLLIQSSVSWSQESHDGHGHVAGEECEVTGMPSPISEGLASDVMGAASQLNPDKKYCDAVKACGGWYQDASLSGFDCKISAKPTCGLEAREVSAIQFYTSSGYGCFNQFIWGKKEGPQQGGIDTLNEALRKLPKHEGFVVRGTRLPASVRDQHQAGATVVYDAFTSTSTGGAFSGNDQFLIYSKTGRPVMSISSISGEDEVLFPSGTRFRVVSIQEKNGSRYYLMREVVGSETKSEAKKEDERITALATELKDKKTDIPYSELRLLRRWECPIDGTSLPGQINLQIHPTVFGSFLQGDL